MSGAMSTRPGQGQEKELITAVEGIERKEGDIDRLLGGLMNEPDRAQNKLLRQLDMLLESLLGPEDLLDDGNYSRPFPPDNRVSSR